MSKKNRNKKNAQSMNEPIPGADENPISMSQLEPGVEPEISEGSEKQIEADQAEPQMEPVDVDQDQVEAPQEGIQESQPQEVESDSADEYSIDDILADVRSSLIEEEETGKSEKKSGWWNRLVKGTSGQERPAATSEKTEKEDAPVPATPVTAEPEADTSEDVEEIDELIKLLENEDRDEAQVDVSEIPAQVLPPVEPEARIDIDELKKQAFAPRAEAKETEEELSDVRQVALGGEEEVFVEVEARKEDPWEERIKAVENALRPYRTYLYYGLAFIGLVMAVMASVLIFNSVKQALPTPTATAAPNMPYPITVMLPGGLNFNLSKGALKDGVWNPRGPEWLEGTEICRWVALPWSRQLEAALRTMNREDVIELVMSNNDRISYQIESIKEITTADLQKIDSSTPCVAVILAKQDSEKRWVAVGRP